MCGIVGLFLKDRALEPQLGSLLGGMLVTMSDRGPDSAGFAVYGSATSDTIKLTIRGPSSCNYDAILRRLQEGGRSLPYVVRDTHLVLSLPESDEMPVRAKIAAMPELTVVGSGRRMEIFKEVGRRIAADAKLGKNREARSLSGGAATGYSYFFEVAREIPDCGIDLGERDLHSSSLIRAATSTKAEQRCDETGKAASFRCHCPREPRQPSAR